MAITVIQKPNRMLAFAQMLNQLGQQISEEEDRQKNRSMKERRLKMSEADLRQRTAEYTNQLKRQGISQANTEVSNAIRLKNPSLIAGTINQRERLSGRDPNRQIPPTLMPQSDPNYIPNYTNQINTYPQVTKSLPYEWRATGSPAPARMGPTVANLQSPNLGLGRQTTLGEQVGEAMTADEAAKQEAKRVAAWDKAQKTVNDVILKSQEYPPNSMGRITSLRTAASLGGNAMGYNFDELARAPQNVKPVKPVMEKPWIDNEKKVEAIADSVAPPPELKSVQDGLNAGWVTEDNIPPGKEGDYVEINPKWVGMPAGFPNVIYALRELVKQHVDLTEQYDNTKKNIRTTFNSPYYRKMLGKDAPPDKVAAMVSSKMFWGLLVENNMTGATTPEFVGWLKSFLGKMKMTPEELADALIEKEKELNAIISPPKPIAPTMNPAANPAAGPAPALAGKMLDLNDPQSMKIIDTYLDAAKEAGGGYAEAEAAAKKDGYSW